MFGCWVTKKLEYINNFCFDEKQEMSIFWALFSKVDFPLGLVLGAVGFLSYGKNTTLSGLCSTSEIA